MKKMKKNTIPKDYIFKYDWLDTSSFRGVCCVLCDGKNPTEDVFSFTVNDKLMNIRYCIHDDLLFLSPQPSGNYADTLYNHPSYFTGEDDMFGLSVSDEKSKEVAIIRMNEISSLLKGYDLSTISLLEVGSAYGHTLLEAKEKGIGKVFGLEYSRDAVDVSRRKGLAVELASANESLDKVFPDTKFDVIALYSVLEHVDNPYVFLKDAKMLLNKNGYFIIRVPRMSKEGPWLSLLDHYWHFTEKSLRELVQKTGLSVIEVFPSGTFVGVAHPGSLSSMTIVAQKVI
jgi:2-polyprenyl-3-methyl-5-hydroxy-6-metoxy-1,4-benzoquinol methylase